MTYELEQDRFYNACMILMNIDKHELVDAGIIKGTEQGGSSWERFTNDPLVFMAKIDDAKRDKLFALIDSRQSARLRLASPTAEGPAWQEFTKNHLRHFPEPDSTEIEVSGYDTQYRFSFSKIVRVRSPEWNGLAPYIAWWRLPLSASPAHSNSKEQVA